MQNKMIGFDSLWQSIGGSMALGANELAHMTGSAQEDQAYNLELQKLKNAEAEAKAKRTKAILITVGIFVVIIILVIVKNVNKKEND